MSKIIKITAFFLFFVMCFYVKNVWAVTCLGNQQQCCKNGELSCCPHAGYDEKGRELFYDISGCESFEEFERVEDFDITLKPVEFCTKGATQEKYTATGCTYETETRTCCGTNWSGWDEDCPTQTCTSCPFSSRPVSTQECTTSKGGEGIQERTVTCNKTTCTWSVGSWGACKCNATCSSGQFLESTICSCCNADCYRIDGQGFCNCVDSFPIKDVCCTFEEGEYRLPGSQSSCQSFAEAAGMRLSTISSHRCAMTIK